MILKCPKRTNCNISSRIKNKNPKFYYMNEEYYKWIVQYTASEIYRLNWATGETNARIETLVKSSGPNSDQNNNQEGAKNKYGLIGQLLEPKKNMVYILWK